MEGGDKSTKAPVKSYKGLYFKRFIFAILIVAVIVCLGFFQYYQTITAEACLQGYWQIHTVQGQYYMLIDGKTLQIIDTSKPSIIYEDKNASFKYKSFFALKRHRFSFKPSVEPLPSLDPMFDGRSLNMHLYPVIGTAHLCDRKSNKLQMVKNNQYSLDHFSL